ncbi:DNA replication endonuclease-helicase Dna2 [Massospora cicadina]|nr:DNA replication endonuclease-helicase Dna2 [Massospora cicadina]
MDLNAKQQLVIKMVLLLNHTIMIAAHTHSVVNTILCKLHALGLMFFLRLINGDKINLLICPYTLPPHPAVATLRCLYDTTPVVATTCLKIFHPLFLCHQFDCCIIDEASQVILPFCVRLLFFAHQFVFISTILFKRLFEAHLQAVVHLHHQYRINQDIIDVTNILVYQGALHCGTHVITTSAFSPHPIKLCCPQLHDAISCNIFLNTNAAPILDEKAGDLTSNSTEVTLTSQILSLLITAIQPSAPSVEVLTIDCTHGRDKDCIILFMVGELLWDWQQLNVGLHLELGGGAIFKEFLTLVQANVGCTPFPGMPIA